VSGRQRLSRSRQVRLFDAKQPFSRQLDSQLNATHRIHLKDINGHSTDSREAQDAMLSKPKVADPIIGPRIEEWRQI
jgi:hypothetical protein